MQEADKQRGRKHELRGREAAFKSLLPADQLRSLFTSLSDGFLTGKVAIVPPHSIIKKVKQAKQTERRAH